LCNLSAFPFFFCPPQGWYYLQNNLPLTKKTNVVGFLLLFNFIHVHKIGKIFLLYLIFPRSLLILLQRQWIAFFFYSTKKQLYIGTLLSTVSDQLWLKILNGKFQK
jgi:hypothetical protein